MCVGESECDVCARVCVHVRVCVCACVCVRACVCVSGHGALVSVCARHQNESYQERQGFER